MNFWSYRKRLIREIWLILKLMTSQLVNKQLQYTFCIISHEVKATMKFGQLKEYIKKFILFKNNVENGQGD